MEKQQNKFFYLIEHFDQGLFDWSRVEYQQMIKYLKNSTNSHIIFTNAKQFLDPEDKEENPKYEKNIQLLQDTNKQFGNKIIVQENKPLSQLIDKNGDITLNDQITIRKESVCLLDMKSKKVLSPSDSKQFTCFLFGGILGDHPPRDRTANLRNLGYETRQLGDLQMSTDIALLTTKLIIEDQIEFSQLPFIDEPEVSKKNSNGIAETVQMEGFRYITQEYSLDSGKISKNQKLRKLPLMDPEIADNLLFQELDFNKM